MPILRFISSLKAIGKCMTVEICKLVKLWVKETISKWDVMSKQHITSK